MIPSSTSKHAKQTLAEDFWSASLATFMWRKECSWYHDVEWFPSTIATQPLGRWGWCTLPNLTWRFRVKKPQYVTYASTPAYTIFPYQFEGILVALSLVLDKNDLVRSPTSNIHIWKRRALIGESRPYHTIQHIWWWDGRRRIDIFFEGVMSLYCGECFTWNPQVFVVNHRFL